MKATRLAATFDGHRFDAVPVSDLQAAVETADIVCCATTATEPVLRETWLRPGTHVDLVGAFKPHMREADDDTIARASVYVDSRAGAAREAGDLLVPLRNGTIDERHIKGDLFELCRGEIAGRTHRGEVTLFKSVGMALEDLAAAQLAYRLLTVT
jgi:ornithine cyclodeaminase